MAFVEKKLWMATNFAATMIKKDGYRNKAIKIVAKYYNVEENDIEKELSKRISKGLKGKKRESFKNFLFKGEIILENEAQGQWKIEAEYGPFKATTKVNALKRIKEVFAKRYGVYPPRSQSYYTHWFVNVNNECDLKEVQ